MKRFRYILSAAGLAAVLVVAGCNVLDSAYEEGGSVENLIEDASFARINGDLDRAEHLLRQAFDQAPENSVVRMDLATTLMQREQINLLALERVTTHVLDAIATDGGQARGAASDTCTWNADEPARPFDPSAIEDYEEIVNAVPVLTEVLRLLNDPASPTVPAVIPTGLGDLDPCTIVQDGELAYDRDAVLATLRDRFGGDDRRVNAVLTMNAVALTLGAYLGIFETPEVPVDWFLIGEPGSARVGFCMDRTNITSFHENIETNLEAVAEALFSLDLLIYNAGDSELQQYVDEALELYDAFETSFGDFCEG